jgi:cytochrome c biogenesis protein CcmG/thiol:disulfide interchange protein DsbE
LGVGVVLVALIVVLATSKSLDSRGISSELLGDAVPHVEGTTLDGETFDIDEHRGRWVVVNFFATWCTPCRTEHPELVRFTAEHEAAGDVEVVSVAFDDDAGSIQEFFDENGGTWAVIPEDTNRVALEFGVTAVPESYVVNPSGIVVAKFEGVTSAGLDEVIDAAGGPV